MEYRGVGHNFLSALLYCWNSSQITNRNNHFQTLPLAKGTVWITTAALWTLAGFYLFFFSLIATTACNKKVCTNVTWHKVKGFFLGDAQHHQTPKETVNAANLVAVVAVESSFLMNYSDILMFIWFLVMLQQQVTAKTTTELKTKHEEKPAKSWKRRQTREPQKLMEHHAIDQFYSPIKSGCKTHSNFFNK